MLLWNPLTTEQIPPNQHGILVFSFREVLYEMQLNLIVNSCHCVTIHGLHNHHLTRNVCSVTRRETEVNSWFLVWVHSFFYLWSSCTGLFFNSTWQVWPQQRSPLCRGIFPPELQLFFFLFFFWLIQNGRGSPKPHTPPSLPDSQAFSQHVK